jgi:hypothetical protein
MVEIHDAMYIMERFNKGSELEVQGFRLRVEA